MKRILLILLCLAFWLPSNASMVRLPYVQDVQAVMVIGSGGGGGAATNYLNDANIVAAWYLDETTASADRVDSANSENLSTFGNDSDIPSAADVPSVGADSKTASIDFDDADYDHLYRTDANLAAGFPGKSTTGGTGAMTFGGWVKIDDLTAEHYLGGKSHTDYYTFGISVAATTGAVTWSVSDSGWWLTNATHTTTLSAGTWYFVAGVFDDTNNEIKLAIGTEAAAATFGSAIAFTGSLYLSDQTEFRLGNRGNGALNVDGKEFGWFVFDRDLSITELNEIRTNGLSGGS